jgi:hypothetical protein
VESSLVQFQSGLDEHRLGLGPLQSFLHAQSTTESTIHPQKTSSTNNQRLFSVEIFSLRDEKKRKEKI